MKGMRLHPLVIPALVVLFITAAWMVGSWWTIPSFVWETGGIPMPAGARTATVKVRGMECRHLSEAMKKLLFGREDQYAVKGYLKTAIFPSPGAGDMVVTWDPAQSSLRDIARAVKYNRQGQLTQDYRVLLAIEPDLSTPAALFKALSLALADRHEELFRACHAPGALAGVDFTRVAESYQGLFVDSIRNAGQPGPGGEVEVEALSAGIPGSFKEYGIDLKQVQLKKTAKGWVIKKANWQALTP